MVVFVIMHRIHKRTDSTTIYKDTCEYSPGKVQPLTDMTDDILELMS